MTIQTISAETGKVIDEWTWAQLLHICRGDEEMAKDFLRHLKHNPVNPNTGDIMKVIK
jgi:hypothetical protein